MKKYLLIVLGLAIVPATYAMRQQTFNVQHVQYEVIKIEDLRQLKLFLKSPNTDRYYQKFSNIKRELPKCAQLNFAMNAGMYHADFQPVGLYVENGKQINQLNEETGFGNFFMQPNGVVAWNDQQAVIKTTTEYKHDGFKPQFATQSGSMLVNNGKMNRQFLPDSNSLKIRNGVGIKDNQLYFVISKQRVSFYQFAQFFKQQLKVDNALYLDGSISSLYSSQTKRHDKTFNLGPIVGEVSRKDCP